MQGLGFASLLGSKPSRQRDLAMAMVAARIMAPHAKLATSRWRQSTTLATDFAAADADENELYAAMDWLLARQDKMIGWAFLPACRQTNALRHVALFVKMHSNGYNDCVECILMRWNYGNVDSTQSAR
ncbi:MAG: hypothetical protein FWF31_12170 [Desulfobulbus sp.]|nr:hypothetical protein [Desulfobulbus sp.]